jgi:glycosyltransferase involved in cell wall biosynthesis
MSKIRILAIPPDTHGVGKYRILDPYKHIGDNYLDDVHVDIAFDVENDDSAFMNYDIVIFHSFIHQLSHEDNISRIKWLKNNGIKVIMDIDDLWMVDQRHPMYYQIKEHKIPEKKVEMLKLADYVTTTTPIFAKTIKDRIGAKNIEIFPNAVNEDEPQFKSNPIQSNKIRFGWLGGSSHLYDIELMTNGISTIHNSYKDKVQFVLCGFDTRGSVTEMVKETGEVRKRPIQPMETVWYTYESIFTDNFRCLDDDYRRFLHTFIETNYNDMDKPYVRRWTRDINTYAMNYNFIDVSLAPLVSSFFNENKSQLKIIEAGFHKKAIIASEVKPYNIDLISAVNNGNFNDKGNSLLVSENKNHKDWAKHMKRLLDNPNMIEDLGNRLYETVKDKYSLKNVNKNRVQFFKTIINK